MLRTKKKFNFTSNDYNGKRIITGEEDPGSFFSFVKKSIDKVLKEESINVEYLRGIKTGLFIFSKNIMQPHNFSFIAFLKKNKYRGMGSSKLFRCTPTNALGSYLAIQYKINGPNICTLGKEKSAFLKYCNILKRNSCIEIGLFLEVYIIYKKNIYKAISNIRQNHYNNDDFHVKLGIRIL